MTSDLRSLTSKPLFLALVALALVAPPRAQAISLADGTFTSDVRGAAFNDSVFDRSVSSHFNLHPSSFFLSPSAPSRFVNSLPGSVFSFGNAAFRARTSAGVDGYGEAIDVAESQPITSDASLPFGASLFSGLPGGVGISSPQTSGPAILASAVPLYWDSNGTATAGAGTTPTGEWGTSNFWNTSSTGSGGALQIATAATDDLFFSAGTDATGAFTVKIKKSTTVLANSITVEEGTLTLSGDSGGNGSNLSLGAGGITVNSGAGAFTINNNGNASSILTLTAAQSWTNNSSNLFTVSRDITNGANLLTISGTGNTTISGIIGSGAGGLTKSGVGTLTLSGANTYTGATTISVGTLSVSSLANGGVASNIGQSTNAAANLVFDGGTLSYTGSTVSTDRNFTITAGKTATIDVTTAATNLTISGASTATTGALTKSGAGTLTLSGANLYTGATNVNAGTLSLDNAGTTSARLAGTSSISVNSGGTLLLAGTATSTDRINNSAGVTLSGGGTVKTGGLSEGTRPTNSSSTNGVAGMGALTLTGTSAGSHATFDFLTGANGSSLVFSSLVGGSGAFLDIKNWTGLAGTDNSATGNDRLLFAANPGLTNADLANVAFFNDSNGAFTVGGTIIAYGNEFELVPVPEPSTWAAGALALLAVGYTQRRRFRRQRAFSKVA